MRIATIPYNEDLHLQDLYSYEVLDTEAAKEYDDLLEAATIYSRSAHAAITFIDSDRQFFKAGIGIGTVKESSRSHAFCAHTIREENALLVNDTWKDERFYDNHLVTSGLRIRAYAGVPIVSKAGYKLGSVCVFDSVPRNWQEDQVKMLTIISQQVASLLELRLKNKLLKLRADEYQRSENELLSRLLADHENSFQKISTELHENIAQNLAATKVFLELAESKRAPSEELVRRSRQQVEVVINQVRELTHELVPTTLENYDVEDLLRPLLRHSGTAVGIETELIYECAHPLPSATALIVYRIVEEQLKNIRQHAKATAVTVNLHVYKCIYLSIRDNGIGVDPVEFKKGVGMKKILLRVESLGGVVDLGGRPGHGCELKITIPNLS